MLSPDNGNSENTLGVGMQSAWLSTLFSGGLLLSIGGFGFLLHDTHSAQYAAFGLAMVVAGNLGLRRQGNESCQVQLAPVQAVWEPMEYHPDSVREVHLAYLRRRQTLAQRLEAAAVSGGRANRAFLAGY